MRKIWLLIGICIFLISYGAAYTITNYDYSSGYVSTYYATGLDYEDCAGGSDFLVQIEPLSCEPLVVTSDLLEEEPVTVYCKIIATQINPFIDVDAISYISITGEYSPAVRGVGYFPSEAALGYWTDGSMEGLALNDLGYVAITLRQNSNESSMPSYVTGTLTARLRYDIENSFGIGNAQFYLPVLDDNEFENQKEKYSFWDGRGYARATSVEDDSATISLYTSSSQRIGSVKVEKGETSNEMYIPGMNPCLATLKIRLNNLESPDTRVRLKVNSDYVEVADRESFLDGDCEIKSITKNGIDQEVKIKCKGDEKSETFTLRLSPKVSLNIDGETEEYELGQRLYDDGDKSVYLGYIGSKGDSTEEENLFAVLVTKTTLSTNNLTSSELSGIATQMNSLFSDVDTGASVVNFLGDAGSKFLGATITAGKWTVAGQDFVALDSSESPEFRSKTVSIEGFSQARDSVLVSVVEEVYSLSGSGNNYLDSYNILDDSNDEIGLTLVYSPSGTPKISLVNSDSEVVANFYGDSCDEHGSCSEYSLSGIGLNFEKGDYYGFFDDVVSGKLYVNEKRIVLKVISSDSSDVASAEYYVDAMEDYETLINSYASQTTGSSSETYGERGLYEAIQLAYSLGQMKTLTGFCQEFKETYPDSEKDVSVCEDAYKLSNSELATYEVQIDGNLKRISFEGIYEPDYEEYGAEVIVKGSNGKIQSYELKKGKKIYLYGLSDDTDETNTEYIELVSVDEDSAKIKVNALKESTTSKLFETNTKTLEIDESDNFGSAYIFTLADTNIEKNAKVTIIPSFNYQYSESTFDFNIGIEKRTILLTDDMINQRIKTLNNTMNTLHNIVEGLDTFNRALGEACLVTGGYLTVKNLIANSDGSAIARTEVMSGDGGWTERCSQDVDSGIYESLEDCFYENANKIDAQVEEVQGVIEEQNSIIKDLQESNSKKGAVDKAAVTIAYSEKVSGSLSAVGSELSDSSGKEEDIDVNEVLELLDSSEAVSQGVYDSTDLKEIQLYAELYTNADNSDEKDSYQDKLYSALTDLLVNAESFNAGQELKQESGLESSYAVMDLGLKKTTEIAITEYETFGESSYNGYAGSGGIETGDYVYTIRDKSSGSKYLIVYDEEGVVSRTYKISTSERTLTIYSTKDETTGGTEANPLNLYFKKYDAEDYKNDYLNAELVYYESGSYKEYPALVPLDKEDGWYAGIKDSDSGVSAYYASGKVRIVWLCNVGKNRLEEFSFYSNDYGDDICQQYDLTHDIATFSGLSSAKTTTLLSKAQRSIEKAQKAHTRGVSSVTIDGVRYDVGKPSSSASEIQCENYMSPKDCRLLFNVCDPVVCPSSRCDFGGTYHVSDVVQTGVVGSVLLCYPNAVWKGGSVYLPICTTGIEAGLKNWINIEESYRDCLQDYLENGEITGTCDRIHSIYACELFWKEAIPLAKIGASKIVSAISGESVRGGAEYLTFASAWENAKNSFDYFTQYYAAESYKAFKIRNTEIGSTVCKASASVVYASGSDLLDVLTTPRSPAQYTGSFKETVMTTATNPPTSHYKVYYYIYAGEDTGAVFQVYLKGSSSSYYQDYSSTYIVDSGYIPSGEYATETLDFTTASGYNQLCISVNGDVECGFDQSVSTSFAENYLTDLYLEEQASTTEIKTESECTSGTASFYSLINPNLQDIVEDLTTTDLYADGITRTCATENPGKETDANWNTEDARWRDVGYCGDKDLRCWIDTESVKKAIKSLDIEDAVLDDNAESYKESLIEAGLYIDEEAYKSAVSKIKDETDFEKKIEMIEEVIDKVFYSNQKASLYLLRGQAYGVLALKNLVSERDMVTSGEAISGEEEEGTVEETATREDIVQLAKALDGSLYIKISSLDDSEKEDIDESATIWTWNDIPVVRDYDGNEGCNCFDGVLHVYKKAGVSFSGFEYCLKDDIVDVDKDTCEKDDSIDKDYLEEGDILSIRWGTDSNPKIHNVIFLEWVDKVNGKAEVFDWIGTVNTRSYNDELWSSYLRAFRVFTMTLEFDGKSETGTVYAVGKPAVSTSPTTEPSEEEETTTEEDTGTFGTKYISPEFIFKDGTTAANIHYKYYDGKWYWLHPDEFWFTVEESLTGKDLTSENEEIIAALRKQDYTGGLEILAKAILKREGGVFFNPKLVAEEVKLSDEGLFEYDAEGLNDISSFFKYRGGKWYVNIISVDVSGDGEFWFNVSGVSFDKKSNSLLYGGVVKVIGQLPSDKVIDLVNELVDADFEKGVALIFDLSSKDHSIVEEIEAQKLTDKEEENLGDVDLTIFSEKQINILSKAEKCRTCEGYQDDCNEDLCEAIGVKLGGNCQYYTDTLVGRLKYCRPER